MKSSFTKLLTLLGIVLITTSCEPKSNEGDNTGVAGISQERASVSNKSRVLPISFVANGDWTVESDSPWCQVSSETVSGKSGLDTVKLIIEENIEVDKERTAIVKISVVGFPVLTLCTVVQSKTGGTQTGRAVNRWMSDYMMSHYLWNDQFGMIEKKLDYDIAPQKFLGDALSMMSGIDDDGGYYASNGDRYYYTVLQQYINQKSASLSVPFAARATKNGLGINFVYPVPTGGNYYLLVGSVYPGSPAASQVKRGQYLTSFNGSNITSANLEEVYSYAMGYETVSKATFGVAEYIEQDDKSYKFTDMGLKVIVSADFVKNPVIYYNTAQFKESNKTVAYMVLSEFDASNKDQELLDLFDKFKSTNATDIIVDLRYNSGGDVYSSTVLATLLLGDAYKGQVYSHMKFNEMRQKKGEEEFFYIGKDPSMNPYPPITDALSRSLNVKTVYVLTSNFTASASELVINGLRGLGVTVYTVGGTTEGKNVGMEVATSANPIYADYDFGDYVYQFAPITFYNLNAQGFKDYGDGFKPDFECDELYDLNGKASVVFDWKEGAGGVEGKDLLYLCAIKHILNGSWPEPSAVAPSRAGGAMLRADKNHKVLNSLQSNGSRVYPNQYYNN